MDSKTGEQLARMRDEEDDARKGYASVGPVNGSGESYTSRFNAIGARIMSDETQVNAESATGKDDGLTKKTYTRTAHFSQRLVAKLMAETIVDTSESETLIKVSVTLRRPDEPRDLDDPISVEEIGQEDFAYPSMPIATWAKLRDLEDTLATVDKYQPHQVADVSS